MKNSTEAPPRPPRSKRALRVAAVYLAFSVVWILFSDRLARGITTDPGALLTLQTVKGLAFVVASAGLVYFLVGRALEAAAESDALRAATERRFQGVVENLSEAVTILDADGRVTYVGPSFERITGYTAEERLGKSAFDRVHPEDVPRARAAYQRMLAEPGATTTVQVRIRRRDDSWRVVDLVGKNLVDNPAVGGVLVTYTDVTERVAMDRRLRESQQQLRDIAENVREIFWIFSPDFAETIYVSPAYEQIWGRPLEEVYRDPSTFVERVHPEDADALAAEMRNLHLRPLEGFEFRIVQPDGSVRWVRVRGYPVRGPDGEVDRVVGTTRDITVQKETEAQLASAEAHYRHLVENAPYAIYALDAEGRFIELNPAGEQFLEMDVEDVLGKHFSDVIAPVDHGVATSAFDQVISGQADHLEFHERIRRPSGEVRLLQVTESAIRQDGEIVGTHGVARDITEEAAREEQLRRAQRLASIGTLVEGVAHELNNPLHSITNFATLLLEDSESEEQREDLETIQREALRAARIVSDLRHLSRRTRDETGDRVAVDMNDLVRHVLETRRYAVETRGITVERDLSEGLPPVLADRGKIEQVVLNLVVNAEQAVQDRDVRKVTVRTRAAGETVALEVLDSGVGIPSEHLDRVFDPFFTTKLPGEGTGLGLAIVHSIIQEHGGGVRAERLESGGTGIRVHLPQASPEAVSVAERPSLAEAGRKLRVLVVDDEPAIRRAIVRYLTRRRGHHVDEAADGREALEILTDRGGDYDVVVSDLRMPGLSGDQLLAQLTALGTGIDRRLIFLTGDSASGHAAGVLAAAKVPVIYKPVELAELAAAVEGHAAAA